MIVKDDIDFIEYRGLIRDMKEVGMDRKSQRRILERKVSSDRIGESNNPIKDINSGLLFGVIGGTIALGYGVIEKMLNTGNSPNSVYSSIAIAAGVPLVVWGATTLYFSLEGGLVDRKIRQIHNVAENVRYAKEHGVRKKGMRKHTLESL